MKKKFKTLELQQNIFAIIDIGSYTIKVAIVEYSIDETRLLAFAEKRQSSFDIENNTIKNLDGICENIKIALLKAQEKASVKVDNIILNSAFSESFLYANNISYKRQDENKFIDEKELFEIIDKLENIHYLQSIKNISQDYLFPEADLDIIVSMISQIKIDNKNYLNILGEKGKIVSFYILNIFLSKNSIEALNYISNYLGKKLLKIIPEEFSLSKLWDRKKEVVIINFGNSNTTILLKDSFGNIVGSQKIGVGISSLIEDIAKKSDFSRAEIIKKINREDFFVQEKKEFLDIFVFLIMQALKKISKGKTIPNNFFIIGGGSNNNFLKKYIEKYDFSKELKIDKKIKFSIPNLKKIGKIKDVEEILNKANLNIISMILTYEELLKHNDSIIEMNLKKVIQNILTKK